MNLGTGFAARRSKEALRAIAGGIAWCRTFSRITCESAIAAPSFQIFADGYGPGQIRHKELEGYNCQKSSVHYGG